MARRDDCVFCDEARLPEHKVVLTSRWGDRFWIFEPLSPVTPGHLLVVPVEHHDDASARPMITGGAFEIAAEVVAASRAPGGTYIRHLPKESIDDFNLITSAGSSAATQTVFHLHVHIVPRREGDGLALPWTGQQH